MNVADIRDAVKAVVEAHATWNNWYSIWSPAKDRASELTYPAAVWGPWRARLNEDEAGAVTRQVQCTLLVVDAVSTERTTADRDATAEAAEEAAAEFILKLRQDYGRFIEISGVQVSTVHDEGTVLETGVILSFTVNVEGPICLDGDEFNPPSNCPTFEELVADLTWSEIKADLSPEQIAAAEADLCDGGGPCDPVTITGTDGLTKLPPVAAGTTYPLPDTHIFFEDNAGQPSGVLLGLGTVVEEGDGHLYPDIVVPSRYVKNTAGNNANTFRATLEDLVNDTLPIAQDGFYSLKDAAGNELSTGSIPSNSSDDITAPDATIEDQDSNPIDTVLAGGTYQVIVVSGIDGGASNTTYTNSIIQP